MGTTVSTFIHDEVSLKKTYLIEEENEAILIDPGTMRSVSIYKEALFSKVAKEKITKIILHHACASNISGLQALKKLGVNATLYTHPNNVDILSEIQPFPIKSIPRYLNLEHGARLEFIPMAFMPFPHMFITYHDHLRVLFSSTLFSQASFEDQPGLQDALKAFHETQMPSSEFVQSALKKIRHYNLKKIYPVQGETLDRTNLTKAINTLKSFYFYNTEQTITKVINNRRYYNYEALLNHMLHRLDLVITKEEILDTFKNSLIVIDQEVLEITETTLEGYKLWHYFFDLIYSKKGVNWLSLLEPLVKKYMSLYNIKKPLIYKTKNTQYQEKSTQLEKEKDALKSTISDLEKRIQTTTDKLLRDTQTNLYNETFLRGQIKEDLKNPEHSESTNGLVLIQIDQLERINKKHGKIIGDETLKHLIHIIKTVKHPTTLLAKQNGPGIFVYKTALEDDSVKAFVSNLRKTLNESTLFIEPVTVSLGITVKDEINKNLSIEDQVEHYIKLSNMKLEYAKKSGNSQIVDASNFETTYDEGTILLVDEDEINQSLMERLFAKYNFDVMIAEDVEEAYDIIETHAIDVIISEINLSKLDGFILKKRLNESGTYQNIPFVIASHNKTKTTILRANDLQIDVLLEKPIIPEELIGFITRLKKRRDAK